MNDPKDKLNKMVGVVKYIGPLDDKKNDGDYIERLCEKLIREANDAKRKMTSRYEKNKRAKVKEPSPRHYHRRKISMQSTIVNPKFTNLNKRMRTPRRADEESVSDVSDDSEIAEGAGKCLLCDIFVI